MIISGIWLMFSLVEPISNISDWINSIEIKAEVTNIELEEDKNSEDRVVYSKIIFVKYEYDGKTYESKLPGKRDESRAELLQNGTTIRIVSNNPEKIMDTGTTEFFSF